MLLLTSFALAGPLDQPDPDAMGTFRCVERPLTTQNSAGLGERKLADHPPGDPVYPQGLASSLVPHAPDAELEKAGKGKWVWAAPAFASLATGGVPIRRSCQSRAVTTDDFFEGCTEALRCEVHATVDGEVRTFDRRPQVASAFSPVDSPREALGVLWFLDPDLFLPMTPDELAAWRERAAGYLAVEPEVPWVEITEQAEGWLVRAPRLVRCGCEHDLVRRAYWVAKDGRSCALTEAPLLLAKVAGEPVCAE